MDIIRVLEIEHQRALGLIEQVELLGVSLAKDTILQQFFLELTIHERAEEEAVWPRVRDLLPDASLVDKAVDQEADLMEVMQIMLDDMDSAQLETKVFGLHEMMVRHVLTEQDRLFPLLRDHIDEATRRQLSHDFLRAKARLMAQGPRLTVTMMPEARVEQPQENL